MIRLDAEKDSGAVVLQSSPSGAAARQELMSMAAPFVVRSIEVVAFKSPVLGTLRVVCGEIAVVSVQLELLFEYPNEPYPVRVFVPPRQNFWLRSDSENLAFRVRWDRSVGERRSVWDPKNQRSVWRK